MKWEKSLLIFTIFILVFLVYEYQGQNDLKRKKEKQEEICSLMDWKVYQKGDWQQIEKALEK